MTAKSAQCPLASVAILDLANMHATSTAKEIYSFSKRDVIAFAEAITTATVQSGHDPARLDALLASAGFVTGCSAGAPAYRMLGSDEWHTDPRAAIDQYITTCSVPYVLS